MISFSIDKQSGKVNVERMSRLVDSIKNKPKDQPLVLVLTSAEQSPTFASRLKKKLLSGLILGGAYNTCRAT
jgi:tRNA A37 threonylcarbamoyladenosine synthetase subunit TsaC/SUA5/YrdC